MSPDCTAVKIPSGSGTSDPIACGNGQLIAIKFPAAMTNTTLKFLESDKVDGTYRTVMDVGGVSEYSIPVSASKSVPLDPRVFLPFPFVKLVGSSNEAAERSIMAVLRPLQ